MLKALQILNQQIDLAAVLGRTRTGFEEEHHLVVTPPNLTQVILLTESDYLSEYHGARAGCRGTVVAPSRLSDDDNGVLVDWGVRPGGLVRMNLVELRRVALEAPAGAGSS